MTAITQETFQKILDESLNKHSSVLLTKFEELEAKVEKKMSMVIEQLDDNTSKIKLLSKKSELVEGLQKERNNLWCKVTDMENQIKIAVDKTESTLYTIREHKEKFEAVKKASKLKESLLDDQINRSMRKPCVQECTRSTE